ILLLAVFMLLALTLVSRKIGTAPPATDPSQTYGPYSDGPARTYAPWLDASARKERDFRQDTYEAFQRQEFDTDRKMEQIKQEQEFQKMQRSVSGL
ncbi:MAG: hypothetical protein ACM3L6_06625, partial [Deltaproteobacteria bacterium]